MKALGRIISLVFLLAIAYGAFWTYQHQRALEDFLAYKTAPSGSAAAIYASKLGITDTEKSILYGSNPIVEDKNHFNADCNPSANVAELGCYLSGSSKIYVMEVEQPDLSQMTEVAMAHEYLHAVYDRLSDAEKTQVNQMVEAQLAKTNDLDLQKRLQSYAQTEPGNQDNELHSIFATEYGNISPELENYYAKYFKNRKMIAEWYQKDSNLIKSKEQSLNSQKSQIDNDISSLNGLNSRMDSLKSSGQFKVYNSLVPSQNSLVLRVRNETKSYNDDVASYNDMIASINSHKLSTYDLNLNEKE